MIIPAQRCSLPHEDHGKIIAGIDEILFHTGQMAQGKYVEQFEKRFAEYIGRKYAVAVGSGNQALTIILSYYGVGEKKIAMPVNNYFSDVLAVYAVHPNCYYGPTIKFIDCQDDLNMSIDQLLDTLNKVDIVLYTEIGGNIAYEVTEIRQWCNEENIPFIEDSCHAIGSRFVGKKAGSFGDASFFSFFPTKILTVGSEGGMLVTDDLNLDQYARRYRHHGRLEHLSDPQGYQFVQMGNSYCMGEIEAMIGLTQLKRVSEYIAHRSNIADMYREKFNIVDYKGSNHYKVITFDKLKVNSPDITLSGQVYRVPCHKHPFIGTVFESFPKAELLCPLHSCLPLYNDMTFEEAEYVLKNIEVK